MERAWLHRLIGDRLDVGTIRTGSTVRAIEQVGTGVRVHTDDGTESADAAVIADGAGSRLRAAMFPAHPGLVGTGDQTARGLSSPVPNDVDARAGELLDHRTGERTGSVPMGDGRYHWWATWREETVGSAPGEADDRRRWLEDRRASWHPFASALVRGTAPGDIYVTETSGLARPLPTFALGRIAFLGDAAHAMPPDLGQGGCQALEDAVALGHELGGVASAGVELALARYDRLRRGRTTGLMRAAWRMNRLLGLRGVAAQARNAAFRLVPRTATVNLMTRQYGFVA
ncbi:FAD-dependent monooxygenase [Actinomycetes bacterium KLBMP 9759]